MGLGRHWRLVLLALVALAVGVFLYVRRDEGEGPELTHAALVSEANAICADLAERNLDLAPPPVP